MRQVNVTEFFEMGGYALYVWPAYFVSAGILLGLLILSVVKSRRILKQLDSLESRHD